MTEITSFRTAGKRHAVDVAQRGVVGVVEAAQGGPDRRPLRRRPAAATAAATRSAAAAGTATAAGATAAGTAAAGAVWSSRTPAPSGAPNWPAAAIGAMPSLRNLWNWFLRAMTIWG